MKRTIGVVAVLVALIAVVFHAAVARATDLVSISSVSYNCDGSTSNYAISYPYLATSDLTVTSVTSGGTVTTLNYGGDFTLNVTQTTTTGTLTLVAPATSCPSGNTLKIVRNRPYTQPYSFRAQTSYNQTLHEQAYDSLEMQIQQVQNTVSTLTTDGGTVNAVLLNTGGTTNTSKVLNSYSVNITGPNASYPTAASIGLQCIGGNAAVSGANSAAAAQCATFQGGAGVTITGAAGPVGATGATATGGVGGATTDSNNGGNGGAGLSATGGAGGASSAGQGGSGGAGLTAVGGAGGTGNVAGIGGDGITAVGNGNALPGSQNAGGNFKGGTKGPGVYAKGGGTGQAGGYFLGGDSNSNGITAYGIGSAGYGVQAYGSTTNGIGIVADSNSTTGTVPNTITTSGLVAIANGAGAMPNNFSGIYANAGLYGISLNGDGIIGMGSGANAGVVGLGAPSANGTGMQATGTGTGGGITAQGGSSGGQGVTAIGGSGAVEGLIAYTGNSTSPAVGQIELTTSANAPSAPNNGDIWISGTNGTQMGVRLNSASYTIAPLKAGTIALTSASPSTATVTLPLATMACTCSEVTNQTNTVKCGTGGTTTLTITGPNTVTDTIAYTCMVAQ